MRSEEDIGNKFRGWRIYRIGRLIPIVTDIHRHRILHVLKGNANRRKRISKQGLKVIQRNTSQEKEKDKIQEFSMFRYFTIMMGIKMGTLICKKK